MTTNGTRVSRRQYLAGTGSAVAVGLAGCLGDNDGIDLAYMPIFPDLQWFVMDEEGYLDDVGAEIDAQEFTDGPAIVQAYGSGDIDIAMFGILPAMTVIDRGIGAKVTAANIKEPMAIMADSDLRSLWADHGNEAFELWEQQHGEQFTFGTFPQGSVPDLLLRFWLSDILDDDPEDVVTITELGGANAVFQAIAAGEVDGTSIMEPVPSRARAENLDVQTMLPASEIMPGQPAAVTLMSDEVREAETATEFVRQHQRATTFIGDNPDRTAEIIEDRIGMPADQARQALAGEFANFLTDPREIESGTGVFAEMGHERGQLDRSLSSGDIFDYSVYESLG